VLVETDRADLERRLRIRKRNLDRLIVEAKEAEENEAPPAVLERLQAQIRVEKEEIRILQTEMSQLDAGGNRRRGQGMDQRLLALFPADLLRFSRTGWIALVAGGALVIGILALLLFAPEVVFPPVIPTSTPVLTFTTPVSIDTPTQSIAPTSTPMTVQSSPSPTPSVVALTPTATSVYPLGKVNVDVLNLRGGPAVTYGIRAKLMSGDQLNIMGRNEQGDWLAVSTLDGATGWVAAEYMDIKVMTETLSIMKTE
jgi:hypothetical protein